MARQSANTILMIEPIAFGFNDQTAVNNYFQKKDSSNEAAIQEKALAEFNNMAEMLRKKGVNLIIFQDTIDPHTPDSIFPNNWITFHDNGYIGLFPMYAKNRRTERRPDILIQMEKEGFQIVDIID